MSGRGILCCIFPLNRLRDIGGFSSLLSRGTGLRAERDQETGYCVVQLFVLYLICTLNPPRPLSPLLFLHRTLHFIFTIISLYLSTAPTTSQFSPSPHKHILAVSSSPPSVTSFYHFSRFTWYLIRSSSLAYPSSDTGLIKIVLLRFGCSYITRFAPDFLIISTHTPADGARMKILCPILVLETLADRFPSQIIPYKPRQIKRWVRGQFHDS